MKLVLLVLCILACIVSFLLPEHMENASLNLDFLGNLNRENISLMLQQQLSARLEPQPSKELILNVNNSMLIDRRIRSSGHWANNVGSTSSAYPSVASEIIDVINMRNFTRHGKLNPIYSADEERISN